jgi:hypothetical protein
MTEKIVYRTFGDAGGVTEEAVDVFADDAVAREATAAYTSTQAIAFEDPDLARDPGAVGEAALLAAVRRTVACTLTQQMRAFASMCAQSGDFPPPCGDAEVDRDIIDRHLGMMAGQAQESMRAALAAHRDGRSAELEYPIGLVSHLLTVIAAFRAATGMPPTPVAAWIVDEMGFGDATTPAQDLLRMHLGSIHESLGAVALTDREVIEAHAHEHQGPGVTGDHSVDDRGFDADKLRRVYAAADLFAEVDGFPDRETVVRWAALAEQHLGRTTTHQ